MAGKGGKGGSIYYRGGDGGDATVIGQGYARGGDGGDAIGEMPERDLRIQRIARRFAAFCFLMSAVFFVVSVLSFAGVMP